jgi:tetratricopeptide (TPR) repeat protein
MQRRVTVLVFVNIGVSVILSGACSGDDTHRAVPTRPSATALPADAPSPDAAPAESKPTALTEAMVAPYWTTPEELAAAQQFALERWQPAMAGFETALAAPAATTAPIDDGRKARLRLMIGLCAARLGQWDKAMDHLGFAHDHLPLLADYTGYQAAAAAYFAHKPEVARALAASVSADSITGSDAEMLIGDVLRDAESWPEARAHYEGFLKRRPHGPRRSEARFRVAEALEHTGGPAADTAALYRRIAIEDPLSPWAVSAHDRLVAIAPASQLDLAKLEA